MNGSLSDGAGLAYVAVMGVSIPSVDGNAGFKPRHTSAELLGTVFVSGGAVMVIEIVGYADRVGGVYAISTVGSLIGTILTGFALAPTFKTSRIARRNNWREPFRPAFGGGS